MGSKLIRGLVCVSVIVALAAMLGGAEAWATSCSFSKTSSSATCCAWKTTSSGYTYCALWCTGSEIVTNVISGVGGNIFGNCGTADNPCPVTLAEAYGTVSISTSSGTCDTSLTDLNSTCGIVGVAYCQNNGGNSKLKNPKVQGTPFTQAGAEGPITGSVTCDQQGKCTNTLKLEADLSSIQCQNSNWTPLTFTASEFKAKACFCPGGFDGGGICCATTDRVGTACGDGNVWGSGITYGHETCMIALCSADLSTYNPLNNASLGYTCTPNNPPYLCGGDSGICCPDETCP